jgi:hypothetical protein
MNGSRFCIASSPFAEAAFDVGAITAKPSYK